ncbi:replication protein A 70 kDa DNA-binding subunit-like [Chenopodium quinoa]|uniref:replication protein A 70 kDa DNA-binding subunit-like n=1 Tax=Chenopodium quinoa TaxID=63459 RepID=UPI000B794332|nr:replication protein A 70 kDa DNA-binding subunit-like [Chenopodium quinoa]
MILIDATGEPIQCVIFSNDVDQFVGKLQEGLVYSFEGAHVIDADDWLKLIPNQYQLNITRETKVSVIDTNDDEFPKSFYNLISLHGVNSFKNFAKNLIVVMGIIIYSTETIAIDNGESIKQDIVILDQSNCFAMRLTIWNDFVNEIGKHILENIHQNNILLGCGLQIKYFNGSLFLTTGKYTRLYINHNDLTSSSLMQW